MYTFSQVFHCDIIHNWSINFNRMNYLNELDNFSFCVVHIKLPNPLQSTRYIQFSIITTALFSNILPDFFDRSEKKNRLKVLSS